MRWTAFLLACFMGGCHSHVMLPPSPPDTATPAQRAWSYNNLRALSYHQTQVVTYRGAMVTGARVTTDYLQLANGSRIYYPEDLLPVLPAQSPSAVAARESHSKRKTSNILYGVGIGVMSAGAVVMTASMLASGGTGKTPLVPILIGVGVVFAGGGLTFGGMAVDRAANDEKATAFETYNLGLQQQLALCPSPDGELVPCR